MAGRVAHSLENIFNRIERIMTALFTFSDLASEYL